MASLSEQSTKDKKLLEEKLISIEETFTGSEVFANNYM